jgi:hypothetical protein
VTRLSRAWCWCCALALLLPGIGRAQDKKEWRGSAYAGIEYGGDSTRLEAGATLYPDEHWRASLAWARSEFDLPGIDATSTVGSARASYDFGSLGLGGGIRRAEIDGVSVTRGWLVNGFLERGRWRFSGEIEARDTDLAPAEFFDEEIPGRGLEDGVARCEVDSTGFQTQASVSGSRWSAFTTVRVFEYEDFACALTIAGEAEDPEESRGRGAEERVADTLDILTGFGPRLIPSDATLLDSSLAIGASLSADHNWLVGAELYRDQERTRGDRFLTALAFANRRLTRHSNVELWIGFTEAEIDDVTFVGIRFTAER